MFGVSLKNGLTLAAIAGLMTTGAAVTQAATTAQQGCGGHCFKASAMMDNGGSMPMARSSVRPVFNPVAFTDSKGHYHPDWYFATLRTSNKRLGLPMAQAAPYALTGRAARRPVNPSLYTDSKGHYHPDWAIHGRP